MLEIISVEKQGTTEVTVTMKADTRAELRGTEARAKATSQAQGLLNRAGFSRWGDAGYQTAEGVQLSEAELIDPAKTVGGVYTQQAIIKGMP